MVAPLRCRPRAAALAPPGAARCRSENQRSLPAAAAGSAPNRWCRADSARCPGPVPAALAGSAPRTVAWRRSCSVPGAGSGCACRFCAEPSASAPLGSAAAGLGAGESASAEPAAWWGVRSLLRPGTRCVRWLCAEPLVSRQSCSLPGAGTGCALRFCAEPAASATLGPAAAGAGAGQPASAEPAACCGVRSRLRSRTSGARWFRAEPVASRRSCSMPGPGTGCARWFCAEPVVSRRSCSMPGPGTGCARWFCAEPRGVAPVLLAARAWHRIGVPARPGLRSPVRRRTAGECAAGAGAGRTGGGGTGSSRTRGDRTAGSPGR